MDSAGRFLFDQRERSWTEHSLYWLYVLERGLKRQVYDWSHPNLYEGVWFRDARGPSLVDFAAGGVRRALARMSAGLVSAWGALKEEVEVGP